MPKFRPYTAKDLPKVVQFIGQCFLDRHFSDYHIGDIIHAMSSRYRGQDLERYFWLFEPQGELIAFAELSKAEWATFTLITHPSCEADMELIPSPKRYFINSYRVDYVPIGLGIVSTIQDRVYFINKVNGNSKSLLSECQEIMQQLMMDNPPDKRVLSTNISASDEKISDRLRSLGYELKPVNYIQALRSLNTEIPSPVLPEGYQIRNALGEHEAHLLVEVHKGSFGKDWTAEEYLKVMRTPGFVIEHELVVVAANGHFAAFLIYWLDPISKSGLFEPVGCHKDFQRRGLTKALMYEAMQRMVNAGMEKSCRAA